MNRNTASLRDCLNWLVDNLYYRLDVDGYFKPNTKGIKAIYISDILDFVYCVERLAMSTTMDDIDGIRNYEGVTAKYDAVSANWYKLEY
jgi:hypothetical protein